MNATSVASSGQMVSPFNPKTQSPSPAFDRSSALRSQNQKGGAAFGLDGAGDSSWAKKNKRKGRYNDQSDSENKPFQTKNPFFKTHDANLSDGGKPHNKKRGGDFGKKGDSDSERNSNKLRDGPKNSRQHNGSGVNGLHHVASTEEDGEVRPRSHLSLGSIYKHESSQKPRSTDPFAIKVYDCLQKDGITPPSWPSQPGNPKNKAEMSKFREKYEEYRKKVRVSLTRAGLIDDPEKRKTLQDAIDFRGICEDMCPEYEKITRITELDVPFPERDLATSYANTSRMAKKLARSAAGQEAPLPMDVRSTVSLQRTLDYLMDDLLQNDDNLPSLHGFLWDRTRAIRRDFTFFSSPTAQDLQMQAYVLENIVRFHVTSLHLLSQEGKAGEDFVEQQELEQLGKALLSLRDLYDDCNAQGIECEHEAEFRAYYLIFHAHDPHTIEMLQWQWKPHLWRDSIEIKTAVSLIEALQTTVDFHGPLKQAPSLAASSSLLSYFRIVESNRVSYIMACFAECHFPHLRRSILRTVRRAMARPKDTTNDVTAKTLNKFLRFDTIQEAIDFAKLHDIDVIPNPQAPNDLGLQILVLNSKGPLPCPRLQHQFSKNIVEKKRKLLSLPDVIHGAVNVDYEDEDDDLPTVEQEKPMHVGAIRFSFDDPSVSDSETELSKSVKTVPPVASTPFSSINQTQSLAGVSQAPTTTFGSIGGTNSQTSSTLQQNAFATPNSTSFGSPATASNPFATAPFGNTPPQNPFLSKPSTANATLTNPFASATPAAASTASQAIQPRDAPQPPSQPVMNSALQSSNPFASLGQTATSGIASAPMVPFTLGEKASEPKSNAPSIFASTTQSEDSRRLPSPFATAGPAFQVPPGPSLAPTQAGGSASVLGGGPTMSSKTPSFPASIPKQGLGSGSMFPSAESVFPKPTVGNASFSFPTANSAQNALPKPQHAKDSQGPKSALQAGSNSSNIEPKPSTQPFPAGKLQPTPNLNKSVLSTTPPTSPPRPAQLLSTVPRRPRDLLGDFTKWFVLGDNGLLREFEAYMVENILANVYQKFVKEEEEKKRKEKEERNRAEAVKFRIYNLSLKYFYRWKQKARERRLRQLRMNGREQFRAFREAQRAARLKEEESNAQRIAQQQAEMAALNRPKELANALKKKTARHRKMAEEALLSSGVLSGIQNEREAISKIVRQEPNTAPVNGDRGNRSRSGSITSVTTSVLGGSKTRALREELLGNKPGRFRRSLPSFSPDDRSSPDRASQVSKVSERWRLKAMGIVQMPDGTALPETMVKEIRLGMKKDVASSSRKVSMTGNTSKNNRFSPSPEDMDGSRAAHKRKRSSGDEGEQAEATKKVDETPAAGHKRVMSDAENLVRELRAMREDLEEGTVWFKEQNGRMQSDVLSRIRSPDEGSI